MEISDFGYWIDKNPDHWFDGIMFYYLEKLLKNNNVKTLVDFGCGNCEYIRKFKNFGYECEGYDGNPYTNEISNGLGKVQNLAINFDLEKTFDCVLSLETGEHIPKEYEEIFIENITKHCKNILILSWAIPGQGGEGHFNEQKNEYIIKKLKEYNFIYKKDESDILRKYSSINWFKKTIMVFENGNNSINND